MELQENAITDPTRVENFAKFFKNYMSIWSVVVAALPIPITSFNLIPVFIVQKPILSTYTTLFCFLLLGFIFYSRHWLAKYFFPGYYSTMLRNRYETSSIAVDSDRYKEQQEKQTKWLDAKQTRLQNQSGIVNILPLLLIILSLASAFLYNSFIEDYLFVVHGSAKVRTELLNEAVPSRLSTVLMVSYLGIFIFAEAAFIMMAVKEYIQDLLKIQDDSLMLNEFKRYEAAMPMPVSLSA